MRAAIIAGSVVMASVAFAKDDTSNGHQLAKDHPWHAKAPSVTTIAVTCGEAKTTLELRRDDREWMELTGPQRALSTPIGRFLWRDDRWVAADDATWDAVRVQGRSLDELFGAPVIRRTGRIQRRRRDQAVIRFDVEGHGTLTYDELQRIWIAKSPGWRVTARERFAEAVLPAAIAFDDGCVMTRSVRAARPKLPDRAALGL